MEKTNVRYPGQKLDEFKQLINEQLETARKESDSLKSRLDGLEKQADSEGGQSFGEDSKNHEQRAFLTRLYERQQEKIHELELALIRISNRTYGICSKTGELISEERLRAKPTATTSIGAVK